MEAIPPAAVPSVDKPLPQRALVHVVAHTHWDREWYLPFEQFRARLVRLVDGLLDILEREPDYTAFMLDGQTVVLDDYLELRPGNAGRLERLARAGRLLVGPWYVLPDEVLVSGESLIRNLARGMKRAEAFGGAMPVGYVPDQFSHTADLPALFRGFGLEAACLWRGVGAEVGTQAFRWRSPNGAEVLVAYLATSYSNAAALIGEPKETVEQLAGAVRALEPFAVTPVYLLMLGNDHQVPRPGAAALLAEAERAVREGGAGLGATGPGSLDWRVRLSTLPAYLDEVRRELGSRVDDLPRVEGELRSGLRAPVLVGTFSSRLRQKQRNDRLETLLTRVAEPLAALAWRAGAAPYPAAELDYAWELLLKNQPHDSICGCSIDVVHREIETRFDKAEQVANAVAGGALNALHAHLDPGPGVVTVVNPGLVRADGLVEVSVPVAGEGRGDTGLHLVGPDGAGVPVQPVAAGAEDVLYDLNVTPGQLRALLPFISGRQVQGVFINQVRFTRPTPEEVLVEAIVAERPVGELDWEAGKAELRRLLADRTVRRFHVVARRSPQRRVAFVARGVPGLGWKQYRVVAEAEAPAGGDFTARTGGPASVAGHDTPGGARVPGPRELENVHYRLAVNPDGSLDVTVKATGRVYRGLHHLVDGGDRGDLYNYYPPPADTIVDRPARPARVRVVEGGPVRATLEICAAYRLPPGLTGDRRGRERPGRRTPLFTVVTEVSLVAGEPFIRFRTVFDNVAQDHRLQAVFRVAEPFAEHFALSHFSVARRPAREPVEDPAAWSERPSGLWPNRGFFGAGNLAVLTRGLPEYTVVGERKPGQPARAGRAASIIDVTSQPADKGLALALTLVRSVGWLSREDLDARPGHAGPGVPTPEGQCPGRHVLEYALHLDPAAGGEAAAEGAAGDGPAGDFPARVARLWDSYVTPLLSPPWILPADGEDLPLREEGLLELERGDKPVVATAVKAGDAGGPMAGNLVVRLVNFGPQAAGVSLSPPTCGVVRLDLRERPLAVDAPAGGAGARAGDAGSPAAGGATSRIRLGPWGVATLGLLLTGLQQERNL